MNRQHSPEPWLKFNVRRDVKLVDGHFVVPMRKQDYMRARACVNACAALPTNELEKKDGLYLTAYLVMIENEFLRKKINDVSAAFIEYGNYKIGCLAKRSKGFAGQCSCGFDNAISKAINKTDSI